MTYLDEIKAIIARGLYRGRRMLARETAERARKRNLVDHKRALLDLLAEPFITRA